MLAAYLCIYAVIFDAFALIDGGGAGTTADDDRRIDIGEWRNGAQQVAHHGFAAFESFRGSDAELESMFREMDGDGKGMVLLVEFSEWIERKEQRSERQRDESTQRDDGEDVYNNEDDGWDETS